MYSSSYDVQCINIYISLSHAHAHTHIHTHIRIHICISLPCRIRVYVYVCRYIHMYTNIYMRACACAHASLQIWKFGCSACIQNMEITHSHTKHGNNLLPFAWCMCIRTMCCGFTSVCVRVYIYTYVYIYTAYAPKCDGSYQKEVLPQRQQIAAAHVRTSL